MTDTPPIWQSGCLVEGALCQHEILHHECEGSSHELVATMNALKRGELMPRERLPKWLCFKAAKHDNDFLPDYFRMTEPYISERFADLLRGFDIGETRFYPIDLYQADRTTKRPDKIFIMNIVSQKPGSWDEAQSRSNTWSPVTETHRLFRSFIAFDDRVAVKASTRKGADLWVDPVLEGCLFFSDRLKRAIAGSNMRPKLTFYRCKIVG